MDCGGLFAMISLVKQRLMWLVSNWAILQPRAIELWGKSVWAHAAIIIVATRISPCPPVHGCLLMITIII